MAPVEAQVLTHKTAANSQDKSVIQCGINYVVWNSASEIPKNDLKQVSGKS